MGSQTLEIMRQGFWASFTGGWFFDPHQDIFCNTFHMYLWLALLLTPFVLHMTASSSLIPTIFYPLIIFVLFAIIKFISHKLHLLFDGEELLEDNVSKKESKDETNTPAKEIDNKEIGESSKDIQTDILKLQLETPRVSMSLKDEINNALTSRDNTDEGLNKDLSTSISDDVVTKSVSNTDFVTPTSPHIYSPEKACIVDLHHTKLIYKNHEKESITMPTGFVKEDKENTKDEDPSCYIPQHELVTAHADNNLIIANEPTVIDFKEERNDDESTKAPEPFPLSLHKLLDSKSSADDSSWASSSVCSSESDINEVKVQFMPIDAHGHQQGMLIDNRISEVKSEGTLSTIKKSYDTTAVDNDKTVSLSALETTDDDKNKYNNSGGGGARSKNPHTTGFSLPEIETMATTDSFSSNGPSKSEGGTNQSVTRLLQDGSLFHLGEDPVIDKTSSISQPRTIQRMGAFRGGTGSETRNYLRFRNRANSESPGTSLLHAETDAAEAAAAEAKHIAMSHEDTTNGAVHCFQDEFGQWYSYAFGDLGAQPLPRSMQTEDLGDMFSVETIPRRRDSLGSSISQPDIDPVLRELASELPPDRWHTHSNPFFRHHFSGPSIRIEEPVPKKYYMLPLLGNASMKISFDRLALLALLDRNKNSKQAIISVVLATLVALFGYILLSRSYFYDFWLFVMCFVIAKCQFSLIKSVQPDSASPVHGHNYTIVFSRAVYFCVIALLIIGVDEAASLKPKSIDIYGVTLYTESTLIFARDMLIAFILGFPLLFVLGLLPQINTFTMHLLEQLDMHICGGAAMTSLLASVYSIFRSILVVLLLTGFCYFPLKYTDDSKEKGQNVMFSVFTGLIVALSYHLSRSTSCPEVMVKALRRFVCFGNPPRTQSEDDEIDDPLPEKLITTMQTRLVHDLIVCIAVAFIVFAVHVSTVFTSLQPMLSYFLFALTGCVGVLIHYVLPQLRKQLPWLLFASPALKSYEYQLYECQEHSRVMWFEKLYVGLCLIEKNFLYPIVCMSAMTYHANEIEEKFGPIVGAFIITTASLKMLRSSFMNTPRQHIILIWTVLFFHYDYKGYSETYLIDYFFMSIFVDKMLELFLKFKFILTYTAPWQITWGSAFHAFAQPVSVPHCGMLLVQAIISAFFSAPLNPFLGSAIFITSYMRPIKFWEKDYNTKRVDHSNTRLSTHIDSNPGADDNNLNSIFYEHLTRSLQHSLCGDLLLGRWGNFSGGDCFIMASDYLNALVHIIEVGNGYVTFQLRGLEFRGTYCQQREVEAITENVDDDPGCCCCNPGHLNNMLSLNAAFGQRWLAWEVTQSKYILEGYSVSDNTATTMFQMFDLRKIFITYYVTSIIFYCCRNKKLKSWLADDALIEQLNELTEPSFVDLDTIFRAVTDKDYDLTAGGITRGSFCQNYHDWITCCNKQRSPEEQIKEDGVNSRLVTLCFALSLLGRRLLSTASNNQWNAALKSFLHGLHALFKGDFRVTATKDEWVFSDPDLALLRLVVAPAVRMALKLHQDHFTCVDEFEDNLVLYETISQHEEQFVICHEGHPAWRQAVLHNKPNLLALRYVLDDGTDDYKIIMLIKRCLNFRVIKVNKECVRGLWAGQLQELIFLRNRNPERGSIQNAKQALRNMINSSCDQPIGYPIYVSPLTTSYAETNPFYNKTSLGSVNGRSIRSFFSTCYQSVVNQYAGHCSNSQGREVEIEMAYIPPDQSHLQVGKAGSSRSSSKVSAPTKSLTNVRAAGSYSSIPASSNSSSASTSASQTDTQVTNFPYFPSEGKARLKDITFVTEALNSRIYSELKWTNIASLKERANMAAWDGWYPHENLIGDILYHWEPEHEDPEKKSNIDEKIYLLRIENYVVLALEGGVELLDENAQGLEV